MKLRYLLVTTLLFQPSLVFAEDSDYSNLCYEDGRSVGLEGVDLEEYVAMCISQYSVEEPTYEDNYSAEDSYSEDNYLEEPIADESDEYDMQESESSVENYDETDIESNS